MPITVKKNPQSEEAKPEAAPAPAAPPPAAPVSAAPPAPPPPPASPPAPSGGGVSVKPAAPKPPPAPIAPAAEAAAAAAAEQADNAEEAEEAPKGGLPPQVKKILRTLKKLLGPLGRFYTDSPKRFYTMTAGLGVVAAAAIGALLFWEQFQYERMMNSYREGRFAQAAEGFAAYLLVNPNDTDIMRMEAVAHFGAGQYDQAARVLNRLQTNYDEFEDHPEIWYRKALMELARPGAGDAPSHLESALSSDGGHVPSLYMRAALTAGEGLYEEARVAFERVVGLMNENPYIGMEALILAREVDHINNLIFNRPAMELSANPPLKSLDLPVPVPLATRTGLHVDAAGFDNRYYVPLPLPPESKTEALPLAGMEQLIAVNLARQAIGGKGDLQAAMAYVARLAESAENRPFGVYLSAYLAAVTDDYPAAIAIYADYQDETGAGPHPLIMRGNAAWAHSDGAPPEEETLALYEKALELDPGNALALNNLGFFMLYLGREDEALDLLQRAFDTYPGEKTGLNLALIEIERGNAQQARSKLYSLVESVGEENLVLTRALVVAELALGLDKSAEDGLARWKKLEPDSPVPYLMAAEIHRRSGQQLLRLKELEEGFALFPQRHDFLANMVFTHLALSDPDSARGALAKVPQESRDHYLVLAARALVNGEEDLDAAASQLAQAQTDSPLSEVFQLTEMRARFLIENGRPAEAQKAIDDAMKTTDKDYSDMPLSLRALELRILADTEKSRVVEAEVAAEAEEMIARADPQLHGDRIVDLSRAMMAVGKVREAAERLDALLEAVPHTRASEAAYEAYVRLGRDEDAEALKKRLDYLEGVAVEEKREDVIENAKTFVIGNVSDFTRRLNEALAANDAETAVALYSQVIETGEPKLKNPARTHLNRGSLYFVLKKYAESAEDFARADEIGELDEKESALRAYQHAFALQRLGRFDEGIRELEKALAYDEKSVQYRALYGHLLRRADRFDEAERVLRALLRESPLQESAYFELADMKRREQNNKEEAIRILLSLLEVSPRNERAHRILTDLYVSIGQPDKADQHRDILQTL